MTEWLTPYSQKKEKKLSNYDANVIINLFFLYFTEYCRYRQFYIGKFFHSFFFLIRKLINYLTNQFIIISVNIPNTKKKKNILMSITIVEGSSLLIFSYKKTKFI